VGRREYTKRGGIYFKFTNNFGVLDKRKLFLTCQLTAWRHAVPMMLGSYYNIPFVFASIRLSDEYNSIMSHMHLTNAHEM
jgi:hypothetical protein